MHFQQEKEIKRVWNKRGKPVSVPLFTKNEACMNRKPQNKNPKENETNAAADKEKKNHRKYMKTLRIPGDGKRKELNPDCRLDNCEEYTRENTTNRTTKKGGKLTKFALVAVSYPISVPAPRVLPYSGKRSDHTWHSVFEVGSRLLVGVLASMVESHCCYCYWWRWWRLRWGEMMN